MKQWKFNALLILIIIGVGSTRKTDKTIYSEIYDEADKDSDILLDNRVNFIEHKNKPKKTKIIIEQNKQFSEDKNAIEKHTNYSKCNKKSGVLALVKNSKLDKDNIIKATPIYVILDTETLSLYSSLKQISLFTKINLNQISKIIQPKHFSNTFCFNINQTDIKAEILLKDIPTILCASTIKEMKDWIDSIEKFKECKMKVKDMSDSGQVLADFNRVNKLLSSTDQPNTNNLDIKDLHNINQSKLIKSDDKIQSEQLIGKELNNIQDILKISNIQETKVKRELMNKLKTAEKFESQVKNKENLIEDMISKQAQEENENETKLISIQSKNKEYELLKAVKERIKELKMQELKEYKSVIMSKIKESQSKADDEAKNMMKMLIDHNKLTDFSKCTNNKLFKLKNQEYLDKVCLQLFGEAGQGQCTKKKQFCNLCCSHHVGIKHANKLFECKTKCTKLVNGI